MPTYKLHTRHHLTARRTAEPRLAEAQALLHKFTLRVAALRAEMDFLREGSRQAISGYEQRLHAAALDIARLEQAESATRRHLLRLSDNELQALREAEGIVPSTVLPDTVVMAQYQQLLAEKQFHEQYGREMKAAHDQLLQLVTGLQQTAAQLQAASTSNASRSLAQRVSGRLGKRHE